MIGTTGSGGTTFARALAQKLDVPHVELESFRNAFLSRESILLFSLRAHRRFRRSREELLAPYRHVRLRSTREAERYLA